MLGNLKKDLSLRENNENSGSRLGGNASELLFVLSNKIVEKISATEDFRFYQDEGLIVFEHPAKANLAYVPDGFSCSRDQLIKSRQVLSEFLKSRDVVSCTFDNLMESGFVRHAIDESSCKDDLRLLLEGQRIASELNERWQCKLVAAENIMNSFEFDRVSLRQEYAKLKNKNIHSQNDYDIYEKDLDPSWLSRYNNISNRQQKMTTSLLVSDVERDMLNQIVDLPFGVSSLLLRKSITLETMILLSLDEILDMSKI